MAIRCNAHYNRNHPLADFVIKDFYPVLGDPMPMPMPVERIAANTLDLEEGEWTEDSWFHFCVAAGEALKRYSPNGGYEENHSSDCYL